MAGLADLLAQGGILGQPENTGLGALTEKPRGLLGALYNPLLDPTTTEQVAQWQKAQQMFTPGDWKSQFIEGLAGLLPRPGATEDQNIYRSLQAGLGMMGSRGLGGTPAGVLSMNAYHGSPHLFDKFDMKKVGSGEGNQTYGQGLYFAENPAVAKGYASRLSETGQGNLYKVDLPDEQVGKMLDWDKPLSQQPESVKSVLEQLKKASGKGSRYFEPFAGREMTGMQLYRSLSSSLGEEGAAKALRQAGIPGVKYLDQGSRAGGNGTSNFVVFDDSIPKILGRE